MMNQKRRARTEVFWRNRVGGTDAKLRILLSGRSSIP